MFSFGTTLPCLVYMGLCPSISVAYVAYEVDAAGRHLTLDSKLLRKEALASREEAEAGPSNTSDFDSTSGVWEEVRKKVNVTAEEPFSASGPPTVVYTAQTASAAATIIMGMTTCFAGLFCLLHSAMQQAVWKTLNASLSWFCALLVYYLIREITNLMVTDTVVFEEVSLRGLRQLPNLPPAASSGAGAVTVAILRFVVGFCAHQAVMIHGRQRKVLLSVASSFGAQLVGLLGADAFATWQETPPFTDSASCSFGLVCLATTLMAASVATATWGRNKVVTDPAQQDCFRESDCTVTAVSLSLTLVQFWRFVLAGRLPHFWGIQRSGYKRSETTYLFITLPFLIAATCLGERGLKFLPAGGALRSSVSAVKTLAYFSAWGTFFWAKWLDHGMLMASGDLAPAGEVMKAEMYSAMAFSCANMALGVASEMAREKMPEWEGCFRLFCEVTSFAMCLTWNSCFQTACAFSKDVKASHFDQVFARCTQCQWMCILLIPSWLLFILPRVAAAEGEKAAEGGKAAKGEKADEGEKTAEGKKAGDGGKSSEKEKDAETETSGVARSGEAAPSAPEVPAAPKVEE